MPAMANITVKNAANTDVIYVAKVPSAGDRSPAKWTADALSTIVGQRPSFTVETRDNGPKNGRVFESVFSFPVIETVNGVPTVVATVPLRCSGTLPTNVDNTKVSDAFVQHGNLLVSTLLRSVGSEGYAPT
jgi:hypothetical protein